MASEHMQAYVLLQALAVSAVSSPEQQSCNQATTSCATLWKPEDSRDQVLCHSHSNLPSLSISILKSTSSLEFSYQTNSSQSLWNSQIVISIIFHWNTWSIDSYAVSLCNIIKNNIQPQSWKRGLCHQRLRLTETPFYSRNLLCKLS